MTRALTFSFVMAVLVHVPACQGNNDARQSQPSDNVSTPRASHSVPEAAPDLPEIKQAQQMLNCGDVAGARERLAAARTKDRQLAPAGVMLARWFLANRQVVAARAELEQVILQEPEDPESYIVFGELAWQDRRIAEADMLFQTAWQRCVKLRGEPARQRDLEIRVHAGLATVAEARKQWDAARDALSVWLKLDETNPIIHQRLGMTFFYQDDLNRALDEFHEVAKRNAGFLPEVVLAQLCENRGDHARATQLVNAAIKRSPRDTTTLIAVGLWALKTNEVAEAKRYAEAALKVDAESLDAKTLCSGIARLQKDYEAAERYLNVARQQAPDSFTASNLLALVLVEQADANKFPEALEIAEQNANKYPQNSEALTTLGVVYEKVNRLADSDRALIKALQTGNLNSDGAYYVAKMLERRGNLVEARKLLAGALSTKQPFAYRLEAERLATGLDQALASANQTSNASRQSAAMNAKRR
jgi:tetratricopeptide (TPR) repeat protein